MYAEPAGEEQHGRKQAAFTPPSSTPAFSSGRGRAGGRIGGLRSSSSGQRSVQQAARSAATTAGKQERALPKAAGKVREGKHQASGQYGFAGNGGGGGGGFGEKDLEV